MKRFHKSYAHVSVSVTLANISRAEEESQTQEGEEILCTENSSRHALSHQQSLYSS